LEVAHATSVVGRQLWVDRGRRVSRGRVEDVVVLLPGILGSVLRKDGNDIWENSRGMLFRSLLEGTGPLNDLALEDDRPDEDDVGDGVTADRLVGDVHMIPGLWTIDGYSKISAKIRSFEGVEANENFFEFPYDWRRDNRVASRRLARCTKVWLDRRRETYPEAKLVLVAHSMGGLIARHFLEVHGGWAVTRKVITIGTPYRGSMQALEFVSNGIRRRAGARVINLTRLARSLTSVYQLLPTYTCWQNETGEFVPLVDAVVPEVDNDRVRQAVEFHREVEEAETENRKLDEYRTDGYDLVPITGMSQPTLQSGHLSDGRLVSLRTYNKEDRDGDGRVMRESGAPEIGERLMPAWVVNQQHGSLQNDDTVIAQIKGALELPIKPLRESKVKFGLDLEDLHLAGDAIPVCVTGDPELPNPTIRVLDASSHEPLQSRTLTRSGDGSYEAELSPLTPATYRAFVDVPDANPVVGVFTVVDG
jgi:pimeloyl-ACP methyl ester carboxylesterase